MTASDFLPGSKSLRTLRAAAKTCQGCELYQRATQTVFGAGPSTAPMVIVGEQPGDDEDRQGIPFVGPAGKQLDRALEAAGVRRETVYLTNTVKHFSWKEDGKRRLHKRPSSRQIKDCEPWLKAEISAIQPHVIVCLGSTAAQLMLGRDFRLTASRGKPVTYGNRTIIGTWHPSAILRAPDSTRREEMLQDLITDLRLASTLCAERLI